jgi:hypothetical protein
VNKGIGYRSEDVTSKEYEEIRIEFWEKGVFSSNEEQNTVFPLFTGLIRSSKTARKAKTLKTKINFPLLPDGKNDRFARGARISENRLVH